MEYRRRREFPSPPSLFLSLSHSHSLSLSLSPFVNLPAPAVNASGQEIYRALRSIPARFRSGANVGSIFHASAPTRARFTAPTRIWRPLAGFKRSPERHSRLGDA